MTNGFVPVLSRLEELSMSLSDVDPELAAQATRFLNCRKRGGFDRRFWEIVRSAPRHEITFILQVHEAPEETRPRKAVKRSQERVYQAVKDGKFDLLGIEGFATDRHLDHLLQLARGMTARPDLATRREIHRARKFCGAFRAASEFRPEEMRAIGVEVAEVEEYQHAILNLIGRKLRCRHEAKTLLRSFVGPARAIFATLIMLAIAEKERLKKPALVMGANHEGEFLALSLLWGFGARIIDTTFD